MRFIKNHGISQRSPRFCGCEQSSRRGDASKAAEEGKKPVKTKTMFKIKDGQDGSQRFKVNASDHGDMVGHH